MYLIFQPPVLGSCVILKLSRDMPKLPKIEFPNSFSFPSVSSFNFASFSSLSFSKRLLSYRSYHHDNDVRK